MRSICYRGVNADFSLCGHTITIYPSGAMNVAQSVQACSSLPFVVPNRVVDNEIEKVYQKLSTTQKMGGMTTVHRDQDDHALYHQDNFFMDNTHYHLKFSHILNRQELEQLLKVFQSHGVITAEEKLLFLYKIHDYISQALLNVREILLSNTNSALDLNTKVSHLIQHLQTIEDNILLFEIHQYLLEPQFYFLKLNPQGESSIWQGTDSNGNVVKTNREWAMIEKTITLQVEKNIAARCKFTPQVANEYYKKISGQFGFFAVKHNVANAEPSSPAVAAFQQCNSTRFEREYCKHFAQF